MRGKVPVLSKKIWYRPEAVRQHRSVLGAMCASIGAPVARFDLPIPQNWTEKADAWLRKWNPDRPLMIYRPLVERTEWSGCAARNPDHHAYAELFAAIRNRSEEPTSELQSLMRSSYDVFCLKKKKSTEQHID